MASKEKQSGSARTVPSNECGIAVDDALATAVADPMGLSDSGGAGAELREHVARLQSLYEEVLVAQRETAIQRSKIEQLIDEADQFAESLGWRRRPLADQEPLDTIHRISEEVLHELDDSRGSTAWTDVGAVESRGSASPADCHSATADDFTDVITEYMDRLLKRVNHVPSGSQAEDLASDAFSRAGYIDVRHSESDRHADSRQSAKGSIPRTSPTSSARQERPAIDATEMRSCLESLRSIANDSTRGMLVQHIRRRHRSILTQKLALTIASFGLGGALVAAEWHTTMPLKHLTWGAGAIGLISFLGTVLLWRQTSNRQKKLNAASRKTPNRSGQRTRAHTESQPS